MSKDFLTAVKERRSYYGIGKEQVVAVARIQELIEHALKYCPSPFNSQSARIVLLLGANHDKLWSITTETLRKRVPAERFPATEEKLQSFANGYGTILFFEDQAVVAGLQQQFPSYAENFAVWSQQSSGMHQFAVWTALEAEGLGASLQHYNPLIDAEVKQTWQIPDPWKLISQMPFGKPTTMPGAKEMKPLAERLAVFK